LLRYFGEYAAPGGTLVKPSGAAGPVAPATPGLGTASVAIENTVRDLGSAIGSGIGAFIIRPAQFAEHGVVGVAFVAASFGIFWLRGFAPERFEIRFDAETAHLLARVLD
jgi:hypothetical protein